MKLKELEKQDQKLGEEIAKLKEEKEWWKGGGFAVSGIGDVLSFNESIYSLLYYKQGRLFKTKEEAEKFSEKERLLAEISREDGVKSFVQFEDNYTFAYHDMWSPSLHTGFNYPTNIYFKKAEQVQKVIDKYGTKLNILL